MKTKSGAFSNNVRYIYLACFCCVTIASQAGNSLYGPTLMGLTQLLKANGDIMSTSLTISNACSLFYCLFCTVKNKRKICSYIKAYSLTFDILIKLKLIN